MANLAEVLKELQSERDRLEQAIKVLQPLVSMNGRPAAVTGRQGKSRTLSAAAPLHPWTRQKANGKRKVVTSPVNANLPF
jgi:hypothetical protein